MTKWYVKDMTHFKVNISFALYYRNVVSVCRWLYIILCTFVDYFSVCGVKSTGFHVYKSCHIAQYIYHWALSVKLKATLSDIFRIFLLLASIPFLIMLCTEFLYKTPMALGGINTLQCHILWTLSASQELFTRCVLFCNLLFSTNNNLPMSSFLTSLLDLCLKFFNKHWFLKRNVINERVLFCVHIT